MQKYLIALIFLIVIICCLLLYTRSAETFEVVIARYNEDLSWVNKEFPNEKVTIYNKGKNDLVALPNWTIISIPNKGRESGTYLYHIISNYYHLADRTLFTQGNPFEHEIYKPLLKYKKLKFNYFFHNDCKNIIAPCGNSGSFFADKTINKELDFMSDHLDVNRPRGVFREGVTRDTLKNFLFNVVGRKLSGNTTIFGVYGAIFAVDKNIILQHSLEYYQHLLRVLDSNSNIDPEEGYYFEKLWDVIFDNGKYKDIDETKQ